MKEKQYDITFHLGMSKSGSTFLQKNVFPLFTRINYAKKHDYQLHKLVPENPKTDNYLFSFELHKGLQKELDALSALHQDYKVVYILRKQEDWIKSKYNYYIRKHGHLAFGDFVNVHDQEKSVLSLENLQLIDQVNAINKHSNEKALFIDFDDLNNKPDQAIKRIASFVNAEIDMHAINKKRVNKSFSPKQLILLRRFNRFYSYNASTSDSKAIKFTHHKYREFMLHTLAFFIRFLPEIFISNKTLYDQEVLADINSKFESDWKECLKYTEKFE